MRNFLKMIDTARDPSKFVVANDENNNYGKTEEKDRKEFFALAEKAQVFIVDVGLFSDSEKYMTHSENMAATHDVLKKGVIDLPFDVCAIEWINPGYITLKNLKDGEGKALNELIYCILINEKSPGKYDLYSLGKYTNPDDSFLTDKFHVLRIVNMPLSDPILDSINYCFGKLQHGIAGIENVSEKAKIGVGSEKRIHIINKVIRILPKSAKDKVEPLFSKSIDFSHQWMVRGHFRKKEGIGKNREGVYCVDGFTWVVPHVKGPEDKILVKDKLRIMNQRDFDPQKHGV